MLFALVVSRPAPFAGSGASTCRRLALCIACCLGAAVGAIAAAAEPQIDFRRDVRTILSNHCFQCHGPDADERKGGTDGLRLDTLAGATADLGGHAAVVPGKPEASGLVARILSTDPDEQMPPPATGKKLSPREIELLQAWIKAGARYAQHWSYEKPVRPQPPQVHNTAWPKNDIDRFLLARLEKEKLSPSPAADRYALIRRLSLDLTGLPPTPAEADAFVNDKGEQAYERLVDRLLDKPAYGEHWAHQWLDLARYADSAGYADDPPRTIWMFRDYVIRSYNANKPFDQFTLEQIAGDLLPNPTPDQLIATAFHRNTLTNNEGGTNDEEFRNVAVIDRVNTTFNVWMGATSQCAQCHNHKYDPISQEEFFRVYAIFNNTADADRRDESPLYSAFSSDQLEQQSAWQKELAAAEKKLLEDSPALAAARAQWEAAFPRDLAWKPLVPSEIKTASGAKAELSAERVFVPAGAKTDVYTLTCDLPAGAVQALRLEPLTDERLPGKGPGHAGGNFVLSQVTATVIPPAEGSALAGRFVRVELPGSQKMLSLAEVQVFRGGENIAKSGKATQSSTDYEGPPQLAIDGNTSGDYTTAKSTTHTSASDNPWWEVDLQAAGAIDRITVWNRTDGNVGGRLAGYRVLVLDDARKEVWRSEAAPLPRPSTELSLSGRRGVALRGVIASHEQSGFEAAGLLTAKTPKKGWGIGGKTGQNHSLTLLLDKPLSAAAGSRLEIMLDQSSSQADHTLGAFRLSATADSQVEVWSRTPAAVIAALAVPSGERSLADQAKLVAHYRELAPELAALRKEVADLTKKLADLKPETVPIQRELPENQRRVSKIQLRGNWLDLGKQVEPGLPAAFHAPPEGASLDRLALARWLIDENNPLTARVLANRYWEQLFGVGIVATSEEFGSQGDAPVHPELLDYLATELVRLKWDLKAFVKLLVTSAAYRQSSRVTPELIARDPDNRLLASGPRFRLSAEMVRDQALSVAGLLSPKLYGPPVRPLQPAMGVSAAFGGGIDWQTSTGEDKHRRGLYTTWRRSNPYPSMATFDAPNREVCTVRRTRTNTPLQALVTLNDPVFIEAAQALARRAVQEGGGDSASRATYLWRLVLTRPPHDQETARVVALYEKSLAKFKADMPSATKLAAEPLGPVPAGMNAAELAAWTTVGNVLLNLDETLMKR